MINAYKGDIEIELYGHKYPMRFNLNVIAAFETNTGKDFNNTAIKAINAFRNSENCKTMADRAEVLTDSISRKDAAWLFYLAANEKDNCVQFDEIQEAVMLEGFMVTDVDDTQTASYPIRFVQAVSFATVGILDELKKKKQLD